MINCCEIALASIVANVFCLAIVRNYYVKMKGLSVELKKKNGHEQEQINRLQEQVKVLERSLGTFDKGSETKLSKDQKKLSAPN
jgi:acyl-[acyl carrier protein]--UDP-N-acetylglucosamine O-acyltransferase